jgi:hypothetical protein
MKLRETFDVDDIMQDLRRIAGGTKKTSKSTYIALTILSVAIAIPVGVLCIIFPEYAHYISLGVTFPAVLSVYVYRLVRKSRRNSVSPDDYDIIEDVLSHKDEETYRRPRHSRYSTHDLGEYLQTVTIYRLYFENGKSLQIPRLNFKWSKEMSMSDSALYNDVHRGDGFYLIIVTKTSEVVAAYPKKHFNYREG